MHRVIASLVYHVSHLGTCNHEFDEHIAVENLLSLFWLIICLLSILLSNVLSHGVSNSHVESSV